MEEKNIPKEEQQEQIYIKYLLIGSVFIVLLIAIVLGICFLSSCTMSFQNISTHGTATDLVDETQKADGQASLQLSAKPIPIP